MSLPNFNSIEMPILQELFATGGSEDIRFLYQRLIAYFPQIEDWEIMEIKNAKNNNWRKAVQKAGRVLDEKQLVKRNRGFWVLTEKGKAVVELETSDFTIKQPVIRPDTHLDIQNLLVEIGSFLGFSAEIEFEYYDVVWREKSNSSRLSHIFEVQRKGNIDSAFAKLKRAFQNQRTKPFLVISNEKDFKRASQSLVREFQDLESVLTILTFVQVKKIHRNLKSINEVLPKFLEI